MTTITITFRGTNYNARLRVGEQWQAAAARAVRRAAGNSAAVWGWNCEGRSVDHQDCVTAYHYRGTVVGKPSRYDRNSHPVLGEASITLDADARV